MPDFFSRADGAFPPRGDSALDELLTAGQPPQDAAGLQPVAAVLAALRAGPADSELAGQARVLAEFRNTVRVSHRAGRARRPAPFRERLGSKLAVITAAAAVAVGGMAAAASVGALPGPLQQAAHDVFAAAPGAGTAHGHGSPAAVRARPWHSHSAAVTPTPVISPPASRHSQPGSARKHHKHKHHGRHEDQQGQGAAQHQSMSGDRRGDGLAIRRDANQMANHEGSRLPLPLPRAAASRFRPHVPTGRGQAGAEPRVRVPTPGGPGPRSSH